MYIKLTKGLVSTYPTKLGRITFTFRDDNENYTGCINGQDLETSLNEVGYTICSTSELQKLKDVNGIFNDLVVQYQHKPGDIIWFFSSIDNKIHREEIVRISQYTNQEIVWVVTFSNKGTVTVNDSECYKTLEQLIDSLLFKRDVLNELTEDLVKGSNI